MKRSDEFTRVLEELAPDDKQSKGPVSLYLTLPEFEEFKRNCGDIAPSKVVDRLIRLFNQKKRGAA